MDLKEVKLSLDWEELFGRPSDSISPEVKKQRWDEWKKLALDAGVDAKEIASYEDAEICGRCKFQKNGWCKLLQLPCGYDPIARQSDRACQGKGYKEVRFM